MGLIENETDGDTSTDAAMTVEQLRAYEWGWGVKIMPAKAGWKIHYYSTPAFEEELGTLFPTLDGAIEAICAVLPEANSEEQKAAARADLARLREAEAEQGDESVGA